MVLKVKFIILILLSTIAIAQEPPPIPLTYDVQIGDYLPNTTTEWVDITPVMMEIQDGLIGPSISYGKFGIQVFEAQIDNTPGNERKVVFEIDIPKPKSSYFVARVFQVRIRGKVEDVYAENWSQPSAYCACVYIPIVDPAVRVGTK